MTPAAAAALLATAAAAAGPAAPRLRGGGSTTTFRFTPCSTPRSAVQWRPDDIDYPRTTPNPPVIWFNSTAISNVTWGPINGSVPEFHLELSASVPAHVGPINVPLPYGKNHACGLRVWDMPWGFGKFFVFFPQCPTPPGALSFYGNFSTPVIPPSGFNIIVQLSVTAGGAGMGCWQGTLIGQKAIPRLRITELSSPTCAGQCPHQKLDVPQHLPNPPQFSLSVSGTARKVVQDPVVRAELTLTHGEYSFTFAKLNMRACGVQTIMCTDYFMCSKQGNSSASGEMGIVSAIFPDCPWPAGDFVVRQAATINSVLPESKHGLSLAGAMVVYDDDEVLACSNQSVEADGGGGAGGAPPASLAPWVPYAGAAAIAVLCLAAAAAVSVRLRCGAPADDHPAASRYEVLRRIGSGSYGVVHLVRRRGDGEHFAMKYVACGTGERQEDAMREFEMLRALRGHPRVVEVLETFVAWRAIAPVPSPRPVGGEDDDDAEEGDALINDLSQGSGGDLVGSRRERYVCIVMPYYPHGDLGALIRSFAAAPPEALLLRIVTQLCDLLAYAHSRTPPVIHRDLKPANVLVAGADGDGCETSPGRPCEHLSVVVTDFGLARRMDATHCTTRAGTLAYLAPECWGHHYGTEADLWAVGCIVYAAASRRVEQQRCRVMFTDALRPGFHDGLSAELLGMGYTALLAGLVTSLLSVDPQTRPTAQDVVARLASPPPPRP